MSPFTRKLVMLATAPYGNAVELTPLTLLHLTSTRVVTVIMGLSSLAFYAMAFRVPVVSKVLQLLKLAY
jgi:hypothetical protein